MSISYDESLERDDPTAYFYKVQILEEAVPRNDQEGNNLSVGRRESSRVKEKGKETPNGHADGGRSKWAGSIMDVQCKTMSYVTYIYTMVSTY